MLIVTVFFASLSNVASAGERLAVAASVANVRSGPGTKYDILWKASKYYPIRIIKKMGSWYWFVDFERDEGWMHKSLVRKIPTVITIKEKCNIRSGPSTEHKIVFTAEKGAAFKVKKRKSNWIYIQHADGDKGWIYKTLVW
jgi:SH3-like domain-containing protein